MKEMQFKAGDKVFSISKGVVTLDTMDVGPYQFIAKGIWYTIDGKIADTDASRSLFTLEEARALGFPVPAESIVFEAEVNTWVCGKAEGYISEPEAARRALVPFIGKRVKVTIEEVPDGV